MEHHHWLPVEGHTATENKKDWCQYPVLGNSIELCTQHQAQAFDKLQDAAVYLTITAQEVNPPFHKKLSRANLEEFQNSDYCKKCRFTVAMGVCVCVYR